MAVYTQIDDDALLAFMDDYGLGDVLGYKGIAEGIENSNYLVTMATGPYILTLYEKRVRIEDLPFFLSLMDHLAAKGVPCPVPVRTQGGDTLRELAGRPAALISFLPGFSTRNPTPVHCRAVGETLAMIHEAGQGMVLSRENGLGIPAWRPLLEASEDGADTLRAGLRKELEDALAKLEAAWPQDLPKGVIHADLFPDNVFFRHDHLSGVIDFYFACNDAYAYDLAVCINAWCFERDGSFNVTKARRLTAGYRSVREMEDAELAALPTLCAGAAMRFLVTRLYDWINTPEHALVVRKDPMEYAEKLNFHMNAAGPEAYGID